MIVVRSRAATNVLSSRLPTTKIDQALWIAGSCRDSTSSRATPLRSIFMTSSACLRSTCIAHRVFLRMAEAVSQETVEIAAVTGVTSRPHSGHKHHHKKESDPFLDLKDADLINISQDPSLSRENAEAAQNSTSLLSDVGCSFHECIRFTNN